MFGRLGFFGRMTGIVLLLLVALTAMITAFNLVSRERQQSGASRFPLPDQAAAIVELLDATPTEQRHLVLRAVSSTDFRVSVAGKIPDVLLERPRIGGLEWLIGQYLETFRDRAVFAVRIATPGRGPIARFFDRLSPLNKTQVKIAVELRKGGFVLFEVGRATPQRLFGIPAGFWVGVVGCVFAALALWAIAREARPLRELAQSVEAFSHDGVPRVIAQRGAPEIKRLIGATNAMEDRIAALIRGRTILLGAVSHDLKTYITRLRFRVEGLGDDDQRAKAVAELDDMTRLVDDSVAVARGAAEPALRECIDLGDLLTQEVALRDGRAIKLSVTGGPCIVLGDKVGLRRLFGNLIENAVRFGGSASIQVSRQGHAFEITIDDSGPGIPMSERDAVFEPFYRLEGSRNRETGGSGLGLAIVKQIVDAHGGQVRVADAPAGGARIVVALPAAAPASLQQPP